MPHAIHSVRAFAFAAAALTLYSGEARAADDDSCRPSCRDGYVCIDGGCVSACNPVCEAGQRCTSAGACVEAGGAKRTRKKARAISDEWSPDGGDAWSWNIGLKGGRLFEGEVYVEVVDQTVDSDAGAMLMVNVDALVGRRISMGGFAFRAAFDLGNTDTTITTLGGTLKARLDIGEIELRPGVAVGYQVVDVDESEVDDITGFDIGGFMEVSIPFVDAAHGLVELGFITQPSGGNDDGEITWGPIIYLLVGVEFGG